MEKGAWMGELCGEAFAQSDFAMCITDPKGKLLHVNDAYRKLYRFGDARDLVGKPVSIIRSPLTPPSLYEDMWKTIAEGRIWRGQMNNRASDGTEVYIHLTISPIRRGGKLVGYLGFSLDRAQQVILERQLMNANKLMAIGTLGTGLAHELNNPLASILLDAEYLRDMVAEIIASPAAEQAEQAAKSIIAGAEKMRRVLEHLLLYSKPDSANGRSTLSVPPLLQDCFLFVDRHLQSLGIAVEIHAGPAQFLVGNRVELESIFHILLSNSMDAFAERPGAGKRIGITVDGPDPSGFLRIMFRDNAGGIPPEVLPHIFEPFFTTKGGGGSGLGLSMCRHILAAHGGEIACESSGGETVFTILLPAVKPSATGMDPLSAEDAAPGPEANRNGAPLWPRRRLPAHLGQRPDDAVG
jgi:PAS domain S-box-containing protein